MKIENMLERFSCISFLFKPSWYLKNAVAPFLRKTKSICLDLTHVYIYIYIYIKTKEKDHVCNVCNFHVFTFFNELYYKVIDSNQFSLCSDNGHLTYLNIV